MIFLLNPFDFRNVRTGLKTNFRRRFMKRILMAYKKTVSVVNETAIGLFEGLSKGKKGFLLESYDKNNGRYTFSTESEEIITV